MDTSPTYKLNISGRRPGKPSKRLTLKQKELKIASAEIVYKAKGKTIEHQVVRINFLPTRQETRLHTAQLQYPGEYEISLSCTGAPPADVNNTKIYELTSMTLSTL